MATDDGLSFYNQNKQKNHDIPVELLDFKYIEKCTDIKELEKIYKVLVSGVEGKYPDLENFAYERLKKLAPTSRALRKDLPILSKMSIPLAEQKIIDNDIENFVKSIPSVEQKMLSLSQQKQHKEAQEQSREKENKDLPPVRTTRQINSVSVPVSESSETKKEEKKQLPKSTSNKSAKPKDYREWEKIEKELDKELEKNDETNEKKSSVKVTADRTAINQDAKQSPNVNLKDIPKNVEVDNLEEDVRIFKADQEKCKGNESFNAGSYEEALVYYSRSIQYLPNSASYNNRALAYLKLEKWDKAIEDCKEVLTYEPENIKALLRRANAYLKKKSFQEAKEDIDKCLKLNPEDKKAQELGKQIGFLLKKDLEEKEKVKSRGGNRLKIEETDGSDEEVEEIDMKKMVNTKSEVKENLKNDANVMQDNSVTQKKQIKITEVEADDEDESGDEEENKNERKNSIETKDKADLNPLKPETNNQPINFDLPKSVIEYKDKAFKLFSNGQYGDAVENYGHAIDNLNKSLQAVQSEEERLFLKNNLAILLNNRASSSQKICEYKSCIKDCDLGLELLNSMNENQSSKNLMLKLLLKKADSFEKLEKFKDAFLVYESLMKIDSKYSNVQMNYNRIKNTLKESGQLNKIITNLSKDSLSNHEPPVQNLETSAKVASRKEELYEENKTKGNNFVKQSQFEEAIEYYTRCVEIDDVNPVAYLNRSLCYLKCNNADLALKDSSFVLKSDSKNVKALFRRAMAYKMKQEYDLALEDLKMLVKLEKNNQIALQELEEVEKLKKAASKTPNKKITVIEEDSSSIKKESIPEVKEVKKKLPVKETVINETCEKQIPHRRTTFSQITNAYEFLQLWNSINPKDFNSFAHLLINVQPVDLPKFIGSKLDDSMLTILLKALSMLLSDKDLTKLLNKEKSVINYLKNIAKSQRFNVIKLFLNQEQKQTLKEILDNLKETQPEDLNFIKNSYDL